MDDDDDDDQGRNNHSDNNNDSGNGYSSSNNNNNNNNNSTLSSSLQRIRVLQDQLATVQAELALSHKDLGSATAQLVAARESSKTRILALKSNPTADHAAVKLSTLTTLQRENADLLAALRGSSATSKSLSHSHSHSHSSDTRMLPASVLDATLVELQAAHARTASVEKTTRRLKEVWAAKSHEFREAIASTLGWSVSFMPNGKMRVESMYLPSSTSSEGEDEHENSIVFDGERGTMKVGGGPRSRFAARIADHIGFWVRERGCVPGLLAALTIEFFEEKIAAEAGGEQDGRVR